MTSVFIIFVAKEDIHDQNLTPHLTTLQSLHMSLFAGFISLQHVRFVHVCGTLIHTHTVRELYEIRHTEYQNELL